MSTNYYLINKKHKQIKIELDKIIATELEILENKLLEFNNTHHLDIEEEVEYKIRIVKNTLEYDLFRPDDIHICKTSRILTWQVNEYWENERQFIKFYNANKDKHIIQNEYSEEFTLEEFLKEIHWENQEVKYVYNEFS